MAKKKTVGSCLLLVQIRIGLCSAACLVTSSSIAAADGGVLAPQENTFSIGLTAGVFLPDSDVHDFRYTTNSWQPLNSAGPAMGLRLSYEPVRYAGVEIEGEMIPIGTAATGDSTTVLGWRAQVMGEYPARLTPFVSLGVGTMGVISGDAVLGDDTDLVWHLGTGAKFYITSKMAVRLDGRWLLAPKAQMFAADDSMVSHFLVTTSLSWAFGNGQSTVQVSRPDPDKDGVLGADDKCPHDAGAGPDGCPAVADRDSDLDGLLDSVDRCPTEAETVNEVDDEDGCPDKELDRDGDTVTDRSDTCPDAAEDMDGFQDTDGCPDGDNDGDKIADADDRCPNEAEVVNGVDDTDGCPDEGLFVVIEDRITLDERILFDTGKARVRRRGRPVLQAISKYITEHHEFERVALEGHADERGNPEFNLKLSKRRAEQVRRALSQLGLKIEIDVEGYGESRPSASGHGEGAWSRNRRVEFVLVRKRKVPAAEAGKVNGQEQPAAPPAEVK